MDVDRTGTIASLVAERAEDDGLALVYGDRRWSWRDVVSESARRATWLRSVLDSTRPPHVGVLLPNTPDYVFTLFGAALAGACVVGLNPTRRGPELERDAAHTECQLVLSDALLSRELPSALRVEDEPWRGCAAELPAELPGPETLLLLIFTSGSTSAPKAVRRTSGPLAATTDLGFTPDDVLYCVMPLSHGNALFSNLLPGLRAGATVVLRDRFSASAWMDDVRRHSVTFANTVGRALGYVLETPPREHDRDHALRVVLAPEASPRDAKAFSERFGVRVISGYGQSEGGITLTATRREGALGRAPKGVDIAVVDPETGEECAVAEVDEHGRLLNAEQAVGELVRRNARGAFEGYWANPEAQEERTRNGWFWSGDLAYRDADGVFWFAGRVGEWLRVDSENFAAAPVERVLARYPGARAVAVVGVPDPQAGDRVLLALEPEGPFDPTDLAAWLPAQRDLGVKCVPHFVRVCAELPKTANDKIDRKTVRQQAWITSDPVWWRPQRGVDYVPFTADDRSRLRAEFAAHGRLEMHPAEDRAASRHVLEEPSQVPA